MLCVLVAPGLMPCLFGVFPVLSWFCVAKFGCGVLCICLCIVVAVCGLDVVLHSLWYCVGLGDFGVLDLVCLTRCFVLVRVVSV